MTIRISDVGRSDGIVAWAISELRNTVFLAKSSDEFAGFMHPGHDYEIIAFRTSTSFPTHYSLAYAHEMATGIRPASTRTFFVEAIFRIPELMKKITEYTNIWFYQPYHWTDDLRAIARVPLTNDYPLYLYLSNKILFFDFLLRHGTHDLKKSVHRRKQRFSSEFLTIAPQCAQNHKQPASDAKSVVTERFSDGGSGVSIVLNADLFDFIHRRSSPPIYRCEAYIEGLVPITQLAAVCGEHVLKFPIAIQVISTSPSGQLSFLGSDYFVDQFLEKRHQKAVTGLTHDMGCVIRRLGYSGIFGVDYLLDTRTGELFVWELNPRFQASAHLFANDYSQADLVVDAVGFLSIPYVLQLIANKLSVMPAALTVFAERHSILSTCVTDRRPRHAIIWRKTKQTEPPTLCLPDAIHSFYPHPSIQIEENAIASTHIFSSPLIMKPEIPVTLDNRFRDLCP